METLSYNFTSRPRREFQAGREYIVAPATLISPGILSGSLGPLYYPREELQKNPSAWNGMPITVYHPVDNDGIQLSAKHTGVWERQGIGVAKKAKANGRLTAECWFDVVKTKSVDRRLGTNVLQMLERGERLELSTGLYTTNDPAPPGFLDHNGTPYEGLIAKNYRPDHVAILPDQKGACSIDNGCGVNNSFGELMMFIDNNPTVWDDISFLAREEAMVSNGSSDPRLILALPTMDWAEEAAARRDIHNCRCDENEHTPTANIESHILFVEPINWKAEAEARRRRR